MSAKTPLLSASLVITAFAAAVGLALFLMASAAHAAAVDCAAAKTQADLATCTDADAADAALNAVYKALAGRLAASDLERLRDAQRAWIPFRDKECAFRTQPYADGSVHSSLVEACKAELTKARLAQLQHQLQCPEGDLSCVPQTGGAAPATAKGAPAAAGAAPAVSAPAQASKNDTRPCVQSAGKAKSDQYVSQCVQVSPATNPPCNGQNACSMMVEEIKRGCAMIGNDNPPAFCSAYKD